MTDPARIAPWAYVIGAPLLWVLAGGWKTTAGWLFLAVIAVSAFFVAMLELATLRKWGGWWGEKNPDGKPRYK